MELFNGIIWPIVLWFLGEPSLCLHILANIVCNFSRDGKNIHVGLITYRASFDWLRAMNH